MLGPGTITIRKAAIANVRIWCRSNIKTYFFNKIDNKKFLLSSVP